MRFVLAAVALAAAASPAWALAPYRSFTRLASSNGHAVVSFNRHTARLDTFLEHPYRFRSPRDDPANLCFSADETRDLAYDLYFGLRSGDGDGERGDWLPELPLDGAAYVPGTGIIGTEQRAGPGGALRVRTWSFMPMELGLPAVVMILRIDNDRGAGAVTASPYALFNFHVGAAHGGRNPDADAEEAGWDGARSAFYEWSSSSQGTAAYVALSPVAHHSATPGSAGPYQQLATLADLDDVDGTAGPTNDVVPGVQGAASSMAPGETLWFAAAALWALDEDAAPDVDALRSWAGARSPEDLLDAEVNGWDEWHTPPPPGLTPEQQALWRQQAALLRMSQVREPGSSFGQVLASMPPGLGNLDSTWNITWVRDMAYAVAGFARAGHLAEAHDALAFQVAAGPGRHVAEVGRPYRLSVTRYFGDGQEESDCNADGPNIEFDGFGLFLWSLGEYLRAGGDVDAARGWWPTIRGEIAGVLVSLVQADGVVKADSSIWEVHVNGRERHFTYTSLAAARGLCEAAAVAALLGSGDDADRYAAVGGRVRDAVVELHTDPAGVLAQSSEDLANGAGYLDAATVEAVNWGIINPVGVVAGATLDAVTQRLAVPSGMGFMRNDDQGWYDSQEWVFVDLRLITALRAAGRADRADALLAWVEGQAAANDGNIAELFDAATGAYRGSVPMAGFGAGAYLLASDGTLLDAACGSYADEPGPAADAGALVDAGVPDASDSPDAAEPRDAAQPPDAGAADAAPTHDAAESPDGNLVDASAAHDGGHVEDAGKGDAGAHRDGGLVRVDSSAGAGAGGSAGVCVCASVGGRAVPWAVVALLVSLLRRRRFR